MVEAARAEPPITVYDSTGKIVDMAGNFAAAYGLEATGEKVSAAQLEMIIREAQAGNVVGDVVLITDTPAALAQLVPQGFVESWLPPDMAEVIPEGYQDPLTVTTNANVWAYNTEVYDSCPVTNIWQLTEPEWRGRVAMTSLPQGELHRLIQPVGAAPRRGACRLRGAVRHAARDRRALRHPRLGQGAGRQRAAPHGPRRPRLSRPRTRWPLPHARPGRAREIDARRRRARQAAV